MGRILVRNARERVAGWLVRLLLGKLHAGIIHDALFMYADREPNRLWAYEADGLMLRAFPANDYTEY